MQRGKAAREARQLKAMELEEARAGRSDREQLARLDSLKLRAVKERAKLKARIEESKPKKKKKKK
jgi:hypothetical protein